MATAAVIGISALVGAANAAAGGAVAGSLTLSGIFWGAALGAAVGAVGLLAQSKKDGGKQKKADWIQTTSIRNTPVPVAYGRCRAGGNWIDVGNVWVLKDRLDDTPGRRLKLLNAIIALCEGPIQAAGNVRQDGFLLKKLAKREKMPRNKFFRYRLSLGTPDQEKDIDQTTSNRGFRSTLPYRNTARYTVHSITGEQMRFPDVMADLVGPDLTLRSSGSAGGQEEQPAKAFYDGFTESFCYLAGNALVRLPRGEGERVATDAPSGVTASSAWYLGRHDVLVMQDSSDSALFHVGYEGIAPDDAEWEQCRPIPDGGGLGYENGIVAWHLDELHGVLHSLHHLNATVVEPPPPPPPTTICDTDVTTPDAAVTDGDTVWFYDEAEMPAGLYRVEYVSGAMKYADYYGYSVNAAGSSGWYIVDGDGNTVVKTPAVNDEIGFDSLAACEAANAGQFVTFNHPGGKIGYRLVDSYFGDNILAGSNPRFSICTTTGVSDSELPSGDDGYILRWNLLTGRVERISTDLPDDTAIRHLMYAVDFDAYIVATSNGIYMLDAETGKTILSTSAVSMASCKGLCVSGQRIGIINATGLTYFDPYERTTSVNLGSSTFGVTEGEMGCGYACQNTWTGHVTLTKNAAETPDTGNGNGNGGGEGGGGEEEDGCNWQYGYYTDPEDPDSFTTEGLTQSGFYWRGSETGSTPVIGWSSLAYFCPGKDTRRPAVKRLTSTKSLSPLTATMTATAYAAGTDPTAGSSSTVSPGPIRFKIMRKLAAGGGWTEEMSVTGLAGPTDLPFDSIAVGDVVDFVVEPVGTDVRFGLWSGSDVQKSGSSTPSFPVCVGNEDGGAEFDMMEMDAEAADDGAPNVLALVNFIPSVVEPQIDVSALGTSKGGEEFQDFGTASNVRDWVRDWSYRTASTYSLVQLEGNSSLAAAMWATLASETSLDSARWGCGLNRSNFSISSFESIHAYAVGGIRYSYPSERLSDETVIPASTGYCERAKFDYLLVDETTAAELISGEMLPVVQGWRAQDGDKMAVGVNRVGALPVWHFSEQDIGEDDLTLAYPDMTAGTNRVRVQYTKVRDEYRQDFAEANDEFSQNSLGRVITETLTLNGVSRFAHAEWLVKQTLDLSIARKQVDFKVHSHLGWAVRPGDVVDVSHAQTSLDRVPFRIVNWSDNEDRTVSIVGIEHIRVLDALRGATDADPDGEGSGSGPGFDCVSAEATTDGTVRWFRGGTQFAPGIYNVNYLHGTYKHGDFDHVVEGYELVTLDAQGNIIPILPAPAASIASPGWDTEDEAEDANDGQTAPLTLSAPGPIGIARKQGGETQPAGETAPTYEVCLTDKRPCVSGDAVTLPHTGTDSASGDPCDTDNKWTVDGSPAKVTDRPELWAKPPAGSRWIAPECDTVHPVTGAEDHVYSVTFELTTVQEISGRLAVDNEVRDILVNGTSTGIELNGYTSFKGFTIPASMLVVGSNTVVFETRNTDNGGAPNPNGLCVVWNSLPPATDCNEPASVLPTAVAISGFEDFDCTRCEKFDVEDLEPHEELWDGTIPLLSTYDANRGQYGFDSTILINKLLPNGILVASCQIVKANIGLDNEKWQMFVYCAARGSTGFVQIWVGDGPEGESVSPVGTYTRVGGNCNGPGTVSVA